MSVAPEGIKRQGRIVERGEGQRPLRLGYATPWHSDMYHSTLVLRWPTFLLLACSLYLILNLLFAGLYMLQDGAIDHARPGSFADAFFFSIQTMATIGYGVLTPSGLYANIVMTAETIVSLLFAAFITGLTFSRFSRPTARVTFSKVATIAPYNGKPTLSVRMSNGRRNQILEADVRLVLLRTEVTVEGSTMRRFYDLPLARSHTPVFSLTFTAMHVIDEASPFHGTTQDSLATEDAELLVTVTGLDETMIQTIHARSSYRAEEVLFGHRFRDMFGYTPEGRLVIDHRFFDSVEPVSQLGTPSP